MGNIRGRTDRSTRRVRLQNTSLAMGVFGASVLVVATSVDASTRADGYDLTRHWVSLLQHGDRGALGSATLAATGVLVLLSVPGFSVALSRSRVRNRFPQVVAVLGASLLLASSFPIDPTPSYPGTVRTTVISTAGKVHAVAGMLVIVSLGLLCLFGAQHFGRHRRAAWSLSAACSGIIVGSFALCLGGVALSPSHTWEAARAGLFQRISLGVGFVWFAAFAISLMRATDIDLRSASAPAIVRDDVPGPSVRDTLGGPLDSSGN